MLSLNPGQLEKRETLDKRKKWFNADGTRMACLLEGCTTPILTAGKCSLHYHREREAKMREGEASYYAVCPVPGCRRRKIAKADMCARCRQFRWRFGLTSEQVVGYFDPSSRKCSNPGCGDTSRLHMDHDHACCPPNKFEKSHKVSCGKCIRGWLCGSCNTALGLLRENPQVIRGLLVHIDNYSTK